MLLWFGEIVSVTGGGLTSFGLGVYVFQTTGSAGKMALVTLIGFLPTILLSIPAGALADKYDRRILMMLGDGWTEVVVSSDIEVKDGKCEIGLYSDAAGGEWVQLDNLSLVKNID